MNAVEIEKAISSPAEEPLDAAPFPFAFLEYYTERLEKLFELYTQMITVPAAAKKAIRDGKGGKP